MENRLIYSTLGRAVAARRDELNLTQQVLADKIGLSRASVANIERGHQKILLHQVYAMVRALELKQITDLVPVTLPTDFGNKLEPEISISRDDLSESELASISQFLQAALHASHNR